MSASLRQFVSALIVAIFMANLGLLNLQQLTMQHEFAHVSDAALAAQAGANNAHHHEHGEQHDHDAATDGAGHADFSHELLHAAEHVQPLPPTVFGNIEVASGGVEPASFALPMVPSMAPDSPFRPPRLIPQAGIARA